MTWAEYAIRLFGYRRMKDDNERMFREVAWASLIGSHFNPKKLPKTKEQFWKIGVKKSKGITDKMRSRMMKATEKYLKEKKDG